MTTQTALKRPTPTLYRRPDVVATMQEDDEAEQEQINQAEIQEQEALVETPDDQLSAEEKTFKKRYGDLRSYTQKKQAEMNARIKELEDALRERPANPEFKPPKSPQEIQAWLTQFPDVGDIVKTIAHEQAKSLVANLEAEVKELRTNAVSNSQARAMAEVRVAHPDFDAITATDDFHEWAERQTKTVQAMLYDNMDNAEDMIAAIKLYKLENGIVPKKSKTDNSTKEAAKAVTPKTSVADPTKSGKKIWKTSEIRKLNPRQFAKVEAEIDEAHAEGRILVDE
jgi:hypothetical protein